jgi:hypothetical protein
VARYALLLHPSANRVYAQASVELTVAELGVADRALGGGRLRDVAPTTIGGVPYVGFEADGVDERAAAVLGLLSAGYALFAVEGDALRPVPLVRADRLDDDLVTIPKYAGKTNEHFTRLLLSVTLLSTDFAAELGSRRFAVLDPLCGRGTTLNQALVYGWDAAGIEHDRRDVDAYAAFVQTWLKRKRLPHKADYAPVRRNRQVVARRLHVTLAPTRADFRAGNTADLTVVNADTTAAGDFFRPGSFDLAVADVPYGVQHGSRGERGLARSPLDLLAAAVPAWIPLLHPGGAVGVGWNAAVARREDAAAVLAGAGLDVLDGGPYAGFRHRVDQAIVRDVLVARKPHD